MNNANLIASDITKKQKAVEAQRRYRLRLKNGGAGKEGTETTYDTYKKSNAEYMRKYRSEKKIAVIKAYADTNPEPQVKTEEKIAKVQKKVSITEQRRSTRETKQVDMSIQVKRTIVKPNINKQVVPKWKKNLPANATEAEKVEARAYKEPARSVMVKKIKLVMENVLLLKPSKDILRVVRSVLTGYDLQGDVKYITKEMSFLQDKNLIAFVNKVQAYYPKSTSFNTMLTPFVNLLARLPTYNVSYQQLTVIAKQAMQDYNDERDENTVKPEDLGKIFSFEPEDVKYHIDEFLDNDLDKAIAACHGLQPPRRLDFQYMRITEDDPSVLNNPKFNYLVMSSGQPSLFVYNNYKTFEKYKKQIIPVADDIVPYLLKYIKSAKLMPIVGQGKYLFGSNENTEQNGNFGTKLKDVFYTMYGEEITSRWIRASAATWINGVGKNGKKKNLAFRKEYAKNMAHSRQLSEQYEKIIIGDDDNPTRVVVSEKRNTRSRNK